jgi:hypothetical protein
MIIEEVMAMPDAATVDWTKHYLYNGPVLWTYDSTLKKYTTPFQKGGRYMPLNTGTASAPVLSWKRWTAGAGFEKPDGTVVGGVQMQAFGSVTTDIPVIVKDAA